MNLAMWTCPFSKVSSVQRDYTDSADLVAGSPRRASDCRRGRRTRFHHMIAPVTNITAGANPKSAHAAFVA
jgi:hypothetical protein